MLHNFLVFYDGVLTATARFVNSLGNTFWGMTIVFITVYCYRVGNHDAAIFFGGVATTLMGLKGADKISTINAPSATNVNSQPSFTTDNTKQTPPLDTTAAEGDKNNA